MAKKSQKRSQQQDTAKRVRDLPAGPKAKKVKGGSTAGKTYTFSGWAKFE